MSAWGWTLSVAAAARWSWRCVVGSLIGILRTMPSKWLVLLGNAWIELFRNIPLLVQIFLWYHVMPVDVPGAARACRASCWWCSRSASSPRRASPSRCGRHPGAARGQRYAGLAMGLTLPQTYRYVLLPMAFRIVIPPLTSESMNIIKNSSVAFAVSASPS